MFEPPWSDNVLVYAIVLMASICVTAAVLLLRRRTRRTGSGVDDAAPSTEDAAQRAVTLERSRRELVGWVSRDLRAPLAELRARTDQLAARNAVDHLGMDEEVSAIHDATDRLAQMVDDLVELTRLPDETVDEPLQPVEATVLVEAVLAEAGPAADARAVKLSSRTPPSLALLVRPPDAVRLVRNVVDASVRHTPRGGVVHVEVESDAGDAVVAVIDDCGGSPGHDVAEVFDAAFGSTGPASAVAVAPADRREAAVATPECSDSRVSVSRGPDGCRTLVRFPLAERTRDTAGA